MGALQGNEEREIFYAVWAEVRWGLNYVFVCPKAPNPDDPEDFPALG